MPFRQAFDLIGELLLESFDVGFLQFLRSGGLEAYVWANEVDFIPAIEALEDGAFRTLPHAKGLAMIYRKQLYSYVLENEYLLDVGEAADFAEKIEDSFVEFPEAFIDALTVAMEEAVDALDAYHFDRGEDPESVLGDWLEQIEKVENFASSRAISNKKDDIANALSAFEMHREEQMDDYRERKRFRGSSFGSGGASQKTVGFSDNDVESLFSSLSSSRK